MTKHTQTIRLNVFGRFVGLTLKDFVWNWLLRIYQRILGSMELINVSAGEIKFRDLKTFDDNIFNFSKIT